MGGHGSDDGVRWRPRMLPPMWLVAGVLAGLALRHWLPLALLPQAPARIVGVALACAGVALALWGERQFARAGTKVIPGRPISAFVRSGPYRFTRNPMYLGMVVVLAGVVVALRGASGLALPVALLAVLDRRFVRHEEAMLRRRFGDDAFDAYARDVRRWL